MELELLIGLLLTVLPITELRVGLPLVINYVIKNDLNIWPYFILVVLLNIAIIFIIFLFLDYLHDKLMNFKIYEKSFNGVLNRLHKKVVKFEKRFENLDFLALILFVAIPLPGTGAWTGVFVAWILGLNRRKSIAAIATGVLIAGIIILLGSLGFFASIY